MSESQTSISLGWRDRYSRLGHFKPSLEGLSENLVSSGSQTLYWTYVPS